MRVLHGSEQHLVMCPQRLQLGTAVRLAYNIATENILHESKNYFSLYRVAQKLLPIGVYWLVSILMDVETGFSI
jgi:hypothetical protein